jgi:hypothetical protein
MGRQMTKNEIKTLCEDDNKLQWWAMVLFAEICDMVQNGYSPDDPAVCSVIKCKVDEFPKLVIQRQLEKVKEKNEAEEAKQNESPETLR